MSYMYGLLAIIGWVWTGGVFITLAIKWQRNRKSRGDQRGAGHESTQSAANLH